ncbi:MAG: hypothetical protein H6733_05855 [Alphaproteobacteria bacterium]|nr:hypothetical protein [Alphaproteobacteria bacterium]
MIPSRHLLPGLVLATACSGGTVSPTDKDDTDDTDTTIDTIDTFPLVDTSDPVDTDVVDTDIVDTDPVQPTSCSRPPEPGLTYVCDLSVNGASAFVRAAQPGKPLVLDVQQTAANPQGQFIGAQARGNRAIAGFHGYTMLDLDDLGTISFDGDQEIGNLPVEIEIVVDLGCDSSSFGLIKVAGSAFLGTTVVDGHTRFSASAGQPVWTAVGGIEDPGSPGTWLLDPTNGSLSTPKSLNLLRAAYPSACVRNFQLSSLSGNLDSYAALPRTRVVSGILLTLGTATSTLNPGQWKIYRVQINDDVHLPPP